MSDLHAPIYTAIADMTPFRWLLIHDISTKTWAHWEMFMSLTVIVLSFLQNRYDQTFSGKGVIGAMGAAALAFKTTFAVATMWDGLYVSQHYLTENGRPIVCMLYGIVVLQQITHLLLKLAMREIIKNHAIGFWLIDGRELIQAMARVIWRRHA